ncbi:MAG: polysaccharide biosynthesis tyrosine autokinase [Alphaproteobacteria bacterium]|nr:polysaccharide biosynthesis tyrosine autokinase [Alphaproteobacteria bacterium]
MNIVPFRQPVDEVLPHAQPSGEEQGDLGLFSLKWLIAFLVRRWMLICATALLVFVVCFTAFLFERPKFAATALVIINPGVERPLEPNKMVSGGAESVPAASIVDSQIDILRSRMLVGRLVDALGLVNVPEFNVALPRNDAPAAEAALVDINADPSRRERVRQAVIGVVANAISVERSATSFATRISVKSENPERAAQMANRLVELFVDYQLEARFQTAERANSWLSTRLRELRNDVAEREEALQRYRIDNGLLAAEGSLLTESQTRDIQSELLQANADLAEKEALAERVQSIIQRGEEPDAIAGIPGSDHISALRGREADIARRQADLEERYLENHPAVQNIRAERRDIQAQISTELQRISARAQNSVEIARARASRLQSSMNSVRSQLQVSNEQQVRLNELQRALDSATAVLQSFSTRYLEVERQGDMRATSAQLVSAATVPNSRASPNMMIAFLLSIGLGLGVGLAAGFLAESLDEGFRTGEEVEKKIGVPALANVPRLRKSDMKSLPPSSQHPAGYLVERQMSAFTEALRVLRTTILFGAGQKKSQVVAISSALPNEGKTTVSLCLARVSALSGQKVLLIDCDVRRRTLKDVLGLEPPLGLLQVLSGEAEWRQAIYVDEASGMHLLPLNDSGFTPKDVFGDEAMPKLIEELRNSFDLIVLDCAPVLAVAETRVVVSYADAAVVVARWEKTPVRAVRSAVQQLQTAGADITGIALNYVDTRVPGYSYRMEGYYTT